VTEFCSRPLKYCDRHFIIIMPFILLSIVSSGTIEPIVSARPSVCCALNEKQSVSWWWSKWPQSHMQKQCLCYAPVLRPTKLKKLVSLQLNKLFVLIVINDLFICFLYSFLPSVITVFLSFFYLLSFLPSCISISKLKKIHRKEDKNNYILTMPSCPIFHYHFTYWLISLRDCDGSRANFRHYT